MASGADEFETWATYRDPVYYRGALVLADLRSELGEDEFRRFLRTVQAEFRWKHVTTAELARVADEFGQQAGLIVRGATDGGSGSEKTLP